jgi:hypothetical protein
VKLDLTQAQIHAVVAAHQAAEDHLSLLQANGVVTTRPDAEQLLITSLVCLQFAAVRQVAQMSANDRAEIARMTAEQCMRLAMGRIER